jgi:citrate lyase beta subunit
MVLFAIWRMLFPSPSKVQARHLLTEELSSFINPGPKIFVLVNGFDTPFVEDYLRAFVRRKVAGIVLPKFQDASQIFVNWGALPVICLPRLR